MADEKTVDGILDYFGEKDGQGATGDAKDGKGGEKKGTGLTDENITAMQTQLAEQSKRIDDLTETNQILQAGMFRAANPAMVVAPVVAAPPEFDSTGLPDPADDPEGYQKAFNARLGKFVSDTTAAATAKASAEAQATTNAAAQSQQLWDNFATEFPELAPKKSLVETAARIAVGRASAKGLDPNTYMHSMTGQFYRDIVAECALIVKPDEPEKKGEGEGEGEGKEKDGKKGGPTAEEAAAAAEAQRTGGIMGGDQTTPAKKGEGEEAGGSLVKDLMDIQKETGFF